MKREEKSNRKNPAPSPAPAKHDEPPPPGEKQVTLHRSEKWIEPLPAATDPAPLPFEPETEEADEPGDTDEPGEFSSPFEDELAEFLAQLDEQAGLRIRIDRLPDFKATGVWGRHAVIEFCGDFDFDAANYLTQVQQSFGPGDYRITLHPPNSFRFIKKWPVHIAAPRIERVETAGGAPVFQVVQPAPPPPDPLDAMISLGEKYNRVRDAFGHGDARDDDTQPTGEKKAPLQERIIEALLLRAIDGGKDAKTANDILVNYLRGGAGEQDSGVGQMVADFLRPLAPLGAQILAGALRIWAGQALAAGAPMTTAAPERDALPPGAQPQVSPDQLAWRRVVRRLIEDCAENLPAESGAYAVMDLCDRYPEFEIVMNQLLAGAPRTVLDMLIAAEPRAQFLLSLSHSEDYVMSLQKTLNDELHPQATGATTEPVSDAEPGGEP